MTIDTTMIRGPIIFGKIAARKAKLTRNTH